MTKVLYSFSIYFRNPMNERTIRVETSSIALRWDTVVTVFGSDLRDAMKQISDEYEDWRIVKVDYPSGHINFPLFEPTTSTLEYKNKLKIV